MSPSTFTRKLIRSVPSLHDLASSDRLIELSYATLTRWGMLRMGERVATKLTEYPVFSDTVGALIGPASELSKWPVTDLSEEEAGIVTEQLAAEKKQKFLWIPGSM